MNETPLEGQVELSEVRRENFRQLVKTNGGATHVAKRLGYRNASFISQQIGPRPSRDITEKTARAIEAEFGLPSGTLDEAREPAPPAVQIPTDLVADVIRLVGLTLEAEGLKAVGPAKFSDLIALAFTDAVEHGGQPREAHVRTLARLLK